MKMILFGNKDKKNRLEPVPVIRRNLIAGMNRLSMNIRCARISQRFEIAQIQVNIHINNKSVYIYLNLFLR